MARYIKPTLETKFHIDFDWWSNNVHNLRIHLRSHLCDECRKDLTNIPDEEMDWIDQDTAEVKRINSIWDRLHTHCSQNPQFIYGVTAITSSIFRLFIANNNQPLTAAEMAQKLPGKSADTILRTIGGHAIYYGIRPAVPPISRSDKSPS